MDIAAERTRTGGRIAGCVLLLVLTLGERAVAFPGHLRRMDSWDDWDSIALGSSGIKRIVPGPSPVPGPDGEIVPGAPELPCLDFVIYGPGLRHMDIIRSTGLECIEGFTTTEMNQLRETMAQFAGYIARVPDTDPDTGEIVCGVTLHNDLFPGPPEISPDDVSYVLGQLRRTFNEAVLGRLVYLPTTDAARDRALGWLADPAIALDFDVLVLYPEVGPRFVRGDTNGDQQVSLADAVRALWWLFVDSSTALECLDAADSNDDGELDLHDPMRVLRYLYLGGPQPAPPFPGEGPDPTGDELGDC